MYIWKFPTPHHNFVESTVYGPVKSWRFGNSLGIDPIFHSSVCSFNCVYCQLGYIQNITTQRQEFVSANRVLEDLRLVDMSKVDVITFSGNGEPTLATNFGEIAKQTKIQHKKPLHILTNATTIHLLDVQKSLMHFEQVHCKMDAIDDGLFQKINRPSYGAKIDSIIENIAKFQKNFPNTLGLQIALLKNKLPSIQTLMQKIDYIQPDHIYLYQAKRPYPKKWQRKFRGDHTKSSHQDHEFGKKIELISSRELQNWMQPIIEKYKDKVFCNV